MRHGIFGLALAACCTAAFAQGYPAKPIRWIVPGGAFDQISRVLAPAMSSELGQPMVVEARAGAAGTVALDAVARAAPDGHTLVTAGISQFVLNPFLQAKVPYDTRKDFAPVGLIGDMVIALYAHRSVDVHTLQQLIEHSKANPGKVFYGTHGIGSSFHLATEILKARTGADLTHVPYKGTAPALQDLYAGRVQLMFYSPSAAVLAQIRAGTIRPLASVSERRLAELPEVPTFDEAGVKNLGVSTWSGLAATGGTPVEVVNRLNQTLYRAAARPDARKVFEAISMQPVSSTPAGMAGRIDRDIKFWGDVVRKLGLKPET